MENLKVNHIYLAKNLPIENIGLYSMLSSRIQKDKEIQRVIVKEITESCYLLSFEGRDTKFYVEKADVDIVYLEDLGIVANVK